MKQLPNTITLLELPQWLWLWAGNMPDGNHVLIAVFTKQSPSEAVVANIARQLLEQ